MQDLDLSKVGISEWAALYRNLSYEDLFIHETDSSLEGYEKGTLTTFDTVSVDTGRFTGRSPKDKYFVVEPAAKDTVWWAGPDAIGSDNRPITEEAWEHLHGLAVAQLNGKKLYVVDAFCGANKDTRLAVRIITEVAWQAHFCKNMFLTPTEEELQDFTPDWTILNACKTTCADFEKYGLRSEVFAANNIGKQMTVIGGTWYGGEMKKGIFTIMNYFLPLKGIGSFHCSANMGEKGDTALFFGLSGTGKTTLSADPKRRLIGDDEHGWDDEGVFNFEGGCYAKMINLSKENEPQIYKAIYRNALLENVVVAADGTVDYADGSKTENTRASYPINHIDDVVIPSKGTHPKVIVFLTCDAFGVMPPLAKLSTEQAMYQYLSGYTARVAGTELGVKEPTAVFSSCLGGPFLALHPTSYADVLGKKITEHGSHAYLVNTGWSGGGYGVGSRMSIKLTRSLLDAIFDGRLDRAEFETMPLFGFQIPKAVEGIDSGLLHPRVTWDDKDAYDAQLKKVAEMFVKNFKRFTDTENGRKLEEVAGPKI
jgi:phosphoenolpyruvate carboxykinase (ATP)